MASADPVFLDTSGLVALLNADDWLHEESVRHFEALGTTDRQVVTTDWVLAELGNGLARTPARASAVGFIRALLAEPRARVVFVDQPMLERALSQYGVYGDKTWGLVDCVSFEIMRQLGCRDALTHDRHFEQAGFRRLLTHPS